MVVFYIVAVGLAVSMFCWAVWEVSRTKEGV